MTRTYNVTITRGERVERYLKADNTGSDDYFGNAVSLSRDGNTLAVGAYGEDSSTRGGSDARNDLATDAGAVYVFTRSGSAWRQQAYLKASNIGAGDWFGFSVSLSGDGNTLAVGAYREDSPMAPDAGAVHVFTRIDGAWSHQDRLKASNVGAGDWFGFSVSLSEDGNTLAVGAVHEDSSTGTNDPTPPNEDAPDAGAAYVFTRKPDTPWSPPVYLKASNVGADDNFGRVLSISGDGNTLVVGANREDSSACGVDGTPDDDAPNSGAAYAFTRRGDAWEHPICLKAHNAGAGDGFGLSVAMSWDGSTLAVGAYLEDASTKEVNNEPNDGAPQAGAV